IYFENIGTATEPKYAAAAPINDVDGARLTIELEMATPVVFDWTRDGKPDILCGDEDGRIACFLNSGQFEEQTVGDATVRVPQFHSRIYFRQEADCIKGGSLISPFVADLDGDGDEDIVAGNAAGFFH
ncbi:MAG: VCBS repeat-containing protein, partial [Thermoguttaceae bacterium]|nr:VCBS repeat-containing protein [Thermoguttaceae bacterium]